MPGVEGGLARSGIGPGEPPGDEEPALTIDELAQRVGMSVRNLREWRSLGLLPSPTMRGRAGYYPSSLVDRIREIQRLRSEGFPLDLIRRMLEASGPQASDALRFAAALRAPFHGRSDDAAGPEAPGADDGPAGATAPDLAEVAARWFGDDAAARERAIQLGLLRTGEDSGALALANPEVAHLIDALRSFGLGAQATLEIVAGIRAHTDGLAALFESLWRRYLWEPYVAQGLPEPAGVAIEQALPEIQRLALDAVVGVFRIAMDERIERSIASEVERFGTEGARNAGERGRRDD